MPANTSAAARAEVPIDLHRLRQMDLNLLVVLRMLLETASVSETARRLDSSQPSISRMLERLRRELDDPLLVKSANTMLRTTRGDALRPLLDQIVELLQRVYQPPADYRLADERRVCIIGCNDSLQACFASPLIRALGALAPHAQLRFKPVPYPIPLHGLHAGEIDILLAMTEREDPAFRSLVLFQSGFSCLCAADNPAIGAATTLEAIARLPYLEVSHMGQVSAATDLLFTAAGQRKNTVAAMSSFLAATDAIVESHRVCLAPSYLAPMLTREAGVRMVPLDGPTGTLTVRMVWHNTTHFDAFIETVRRLLVEAARHLAQPAGT